MLKSIAGWFVSGYQQLLLGLTVVAIATVGAYIRGHSDGENAILAGETKAYAAALSDFREKVDKTLKKATDDAFADFNAKLGVMSKIIAKLEHEQEVSRANADALAAAMRGRFTLSPDERLRLECIRRPADARCASAAGATVRPAIPQ